jgi:hypothetical protein
MSFTIVLNINEGDETTIPTNLFCKVYDNGTLIHTTGKVSDDPNVSYQSGQITIVQVPETPTPNLITVTLIDEAQNESKQSNYIDLGNPLFYASGFYESGFYENAS